MNAQNVFSQGTEKVKKFLQCPLGFRDMAMNGRAGAGGTAAVPRWHDRCVLISRLFCFLMSIALVGCSIGNRPGVSSMQSPAGDFASLKQSDNPLGPSTQDMNSSNELSLIIPRGSSITTVEVNAQKTNTTQITVSEPTPMVKKETHSHAAVIGAAQTDTSKALAAKYKALLPVMIVGILFILGGGAFAYFGWWTKAAIMWGIGVAMITFAAVLPGHEVLIISIGLSVAVVAILLVLYIYHKGKLDTYVANAEHALGLATVSKTQNTTLVGAVASGPLD